MADVVLVRPGSESRGEDHWNHGLPLGLAYLASIARARSLSPRVVDGRLLGHRTTAETVKAVLASAPRFVGISAMTVDFPRAMEIARGVKEADPEVVTILGGPHANALPRESLTEADAVDYVLAGEPFHELTDLVQSLDAGERRSDIAGLCWREGGRVHGPAGAAFLGDDAVQRLPLPAWDLFPRSTTYPVITQLGCPFSCVFCSHNSTRAMRYRPVGAVLEELAWLDREYRPSVVNFIDETFGLKPSRTYELLDHMARLGLGSRIRFTAQTRVDCVSEPLLRLMKSAGFEFVELGVESGDPGVIARSGKDLDLALLESAVTLAKRVGLKVWLKFILGLPGETARSVRHTIDLAVALNPDRLSVATIVPYPGSQVYEWARAGEGGYRLLSSDWRHFDKYRGRCLELEGISYRTLRRLQAQMYVETYLRNGRVGELGRMVWQNAAFVTSYAWSAFGRAHAS